MSRWAALLAGGSGTRFWPLSTQSRPKQLLPLAGDAPLLVQSVRRLEGIVPPERVVVITSRALADETRRLLPDVPPDQVLAEPRAASTGPALVWATETIRARDAEASILSLHADWWIGDDDAFRRTAVKALDVAERHDVLVTVGIVPTRPDTGYGYIEPGDPLDADVRRVARFTEKPSAVVAGRLVARGALWNSGLFAWRADRLVRETEAHAPEIAPQLSVLRAGDIEGFFRKVTPIAIDVSHFERSDRVAVVPGAYPWDDVGTWSALARVRARDEQGNVASGDVVLHASDRCVAWADDGTIVLDGVSDLVVVRANGVTLVTTRERAAQLKLLLESLPERLRNL